MSIKYPRPSRKKKPAASRADTPSPRHAVTSAPHPAPKSESTNPLDGLQLKEDDVSTPSPPLGEKVAEGRMRGIPHSALRAPNLIFSSPTVWLYHDNCLAVLDAIAAKYPEGRFDMIFADPPYFLSNGGITCHAGRMVKVDKGEWDKSKGIEENHNFNTEWLKRCQRVLKPNGTIWVTGTHHVIFSVGFALQQLGFKILNDIAWEKPNPPPNLSCRYFTHSTETILWAAKNEKSKHVFNYQDMRKVTGKQMKTVWRQKEFALGGTGYQPVVSGNLPDTSEAPEDSVGGSPTDTGKLPVPPGKTSVSSCENPDSALDSVWTMTAPGRDEKTHGKHPTQKPIALLERCLLAATNEGDLILDPFLGGGTTAIAALRLKRRFIGIELDLTHLHLAARRADFEVVAIWLRSFSVRTQIVVMSSLRLDSEFLQKDLAEFPKLIDRSDPMADKPEIQTDRIYHETKFVFLSCAHVSDASVVHTTVDVSLQDAWAKTPNGKKRETTHIVRCETEIFRVEKTSSNP